MSNNNADDNLAAAVKKEGDDKKPQSKYNQLQARYKSISEGFFQSAADLELRQALTPMIGRVDTIFIAGLGSPEELQEGTLRQVAMMVIARDVLRGPQQQHKVKVLQTDPKTTELDDYFLHDCLGDDYTDILHDWATKEADKRPEKYILRVGEQDHTADSWPERSPVERDFHHITTSTLLFLPYPPVSCTLRYVGGTSPAMIITGSLAGLWRYAILRQPKYRYADHESTESFRAQWKLEYEAWERLMSKYQRRALVRHNAFANTQPQNGLGVYLPLAHGDNVRNGWSTGGAGLNLRLEDAEYALLNC